LLMVKLSACWSRSLSRDKRKPQGWSKTPHEWGIVVRLANGTSLYYCLDERVVDHRGNPYERWGLLSQAYRFPSEGDARRVAAAMQTNSAAKEYTVVPLPLPTRSSRSAQRPTRPGRHLPSQGM